MLHLKSNQLVNKVCFHKNQQSGAPVASCYRKVRRFAWMEDTVTCKKIGFTKTFVWQKSLVLCIWWRHPEGYLAAWRHRLIAKEIAVDRNRDVKIGWSTSSLGCRMTHFSYLRKVFVLQWMRENPFEILYVDSSFKLFSGVFSLSFNVRVSSNVCRQLRFFSRIFCKAFAGV